jgi:hypothetical protein
MKTSLFLRISKISLGCENYSKRTVSLYFVKRAELFICMAMKIARA